MSSMRIIIGRKTRCSWNETVETLSRGSQESTPMRKQSATVSELLNLVSLLSARAWPLLTLEQSMISTTPSAARPDISMSSIESLQADMEACFPLPSEQGLKRWHSMTPWRQPKVQAWVPTLRSGWCRPNACAVTVLTKSSSPYTLLAHYGELDWVSKIRRMVLSLQRLISLGCPIRGEARSYKNECRS